MLNLILLTTGTSRYLTKGTESLHIMQAFFYNYGIRFSLKGWIQERKLIIGPQSLSTEKEYSWVTYRNSDKFFFVWVAFLCLPIGVFPSTIIYEIHFFDLFSRSENANRNLFRALSQNPIIKNIHPFHIAILVPSIDTPYCLNKPVRGWTWTIHWNTR